MTWKFIIVVPAAAVVGGWYRCTAISHVILSCCAVDGFRINMVLICCSRTCWNSRQHTLGTELIRISCRSCTPTVAMAFDAFPLSDELVLRSVRDLASACVDPSRALDLLNSKRCSQVHIPAAPAATSSSAAAHGGPGPMQHDDLGTPCSGQPSPCAARVANADVLVLPYTSPTGKTSYHPFVCDLQQQQQQHGLTQQAQVAGSHGNAEETAGELLAMRQAGLWAAAARMAIAHSGEAASLRLSVSGAGVDAVKAAFHEAGYNTSYDNAYYRCAVRCHVLHAKRQLTFGRAWHSASQGQSGSFLVAFPCI